MNPNRTPPKAAFSLCIGLAAFLLAGCAAGELEQAPPPSERQFDELDSYIETTMRDWRVPGVALAIVGRDGVIHTATYGTTDITNGDPVDTDTIFAVGSNGKSLTAAMLGALQDEGALDLSQPIGSVLPDFAMADSDHDAVTFEDALSHLSGLPTQSGLGAWYLQGADQPSLVQSIRRVKPVAPLRTRFGYNNSMFAAAAQAAETATGKDYHALMQAKLFTPLGMKRSSTSLDQFPDGNLAKPHGYVGGQPVRIAFHPVIGAAAAGSVNASLMDMTRFIRMMLNGGTMDGKTVITQQTAGAIQSVRHELAPDEMPEIFQILGGVEYPQEVGQLGYGLGLANVEYFGSDYAFHGGSIDGMTSWMMWSPQAGVGVVVLTNSGNIAYPAWASFAAVNAAAGLPADRTLVRLASMRDAIIADPPTPEGNGMAPALPVAELAGVYANPLGGFEIVAGAKGHADLRFIKTGYEADVTSLGGPDYWVDFANPALPDFGLTLTSQTGESPLILSESPSEYPALFAADPAFTRRVD
ncbi:serine hydrolase domain-containing protein [Croceicoccus mobilis]|uniref:Serine hydrolase n=1 Tax=Croceicoccus mobilis TaxID=1703339 RepID=A0A916YVE1_9SPHN|nr:serine hydrolase domain-containing protein [Croceicoccus mobilis]GGD62940.1 serine hydrolase [Croceicoccus mobilis]